MEYCRYLEEIDFVGFFTYQRAEEAPVMGNKREKY